MSMHETKTISLSLNFNNENRYHFDVEISARTYSDGAWDLTGVNSNGETFALGALGKALMRLLTQLDHATKTKRKAWYEP